MWHTCALTIYVSVDVTLPVSSAKTEAGPASIPLLELRLVTPAFLAGWSKCSSERQIYRYATSRLHDASPTLPDRSEFNRLVHHHPHLIPAVALHRAESDGSSSVPPPGVVHLGDVR